MSDKRYIGGEAPMAYSVSPSSVHTARPDLMEGEEEIPDPSFEMNNSQAQVPGIPTDQPQHLTGEVPDEEMEQTINHMKYVYGKMMVYTTKTRPLKMQELQSLAARLASVEKSLDLVSPDSRQALVEMIGAQRQMGREIEEQIKLHDKNMEDARKYIVGELETLVAEYQARFRHWMTDFKWPNVEACRVLQAPEAVIQLVAKVESQWYAMEISPAETGESAIVQELRRQLRELQMEKRKGTQGIKEQVDSLGGVKKEGLPAGYILERRRRIQTPSFAKGNIGEAKDWLAEYKSVCQHLQYTEQERLDELSVRLKGMALTWYNYLLPESKKSWDVFEQAFRDYFAGGANTVEAAMNELKQLRQGNKKMVVFGQELREVARRAEIHADRMLIGYLKSAVNPEMTRAIIYRGPTTYTEAVNICIEVENDLIRNLGDKTSYTPAYANTPVTPPQEGVLQNFQKKDVRDQKKSGVRCFKCKKVGHMKKDCWSKKESGTGFFLSSFRITTMLRRMVLSRMALGSRSILKLKPGNN
ncbi:hypothetical protein EDC96DRAFT_494103 [Choanephora cucurbitarum]|nr:hypothetical protein EDC96DRAFT_494103 [Choanephora cucurbitarum]